MSGSERKRHHSRDVNERGKEREEGYKRRKKVGIFDLQGVYKERLKEGNLQIHGPNWGDI